VGRGFGSADREQARGRWGNRFGRTMKAEDWLDRAICRGNRYELYRKVLKGVMVGWVVQL